MPLLLSENDLPSISSVDALDGDCFDVSLSNGHAILLDLSSRIREPAFAEIIKANVFDRPQTDGKHLFWIGGPSLTVLDIFKMLTSARKEDMPMG